MLDELVLVSCGACGGDGYTLYSARSSSDSLPAETTCRCEVCGGTGEVEVCGGCLEVPTVAGGLELCGCIAFLLRRAA